MSSRLGIVECFTTGIRALMKNDSTLGIQNGWQTEEFVSSARRFTAGFMALREGVRAWTSNNAAVERQKSMPIRKRR